MKGNNSHRTRLGLEGGFVEVTEQNIRTAYFYFWHHSPGRVQTTSPIQLTTSQTEAPQTRLPCVNSLEKITQSFLRRAVPNTRDPEGDPRSALIMVAHVFS